MFLVMFLTFNPAVNYGLHELGPSWRVHWSRHDQVQQHSVTLRVGKLPLKKAKPAKFVLQAYDSTPQKRQKEADVEEGWDQNLPNIS